MTQPGVGPITSLAFVITMGDVRRFQNGKQVSNYLGLIPSEHSSSKRRRPSLRYHPMPPRTTEESCRPRDYDRTIGLPWQPRLACEASAPDDAVLACHENQGHKEHERAAMQPAHSRPMQRRIHTGLDVTRITRVPVERTEISLDTPFHRASNTGLPTLSLGRPITLPTFPAE